MLFADGQAIRGMRLAIAFTQPPANNTGAIAPDLYFALCVGCQPHIIIIALSIELVNA